MTDFVCFAALDVDGTAGAELVAGDTLIFIGSAAQSATATPTGDVFHVTEIATGDGLDCGPSEFRVTVRPAIDYTAEKIDAAGTRATTLWHQLYHPGYAASYLLGWRLAFANRDDWGPQEPNLLSNGRMEFTAAGAPGWVTTNASLGGTQFPATADPWSSAQCVEGEPGHGPYACTTVTDASCDGTGAGFVENDADLDGTADWIDVEPGARYILRADLTASLGDQFGLYADANGDGALEPLAGTTEWSATDPALLRTRYFGLPAHWARIFTIPENISRVRVRYVTTSASADGAPTLDDVSLRKVSMPDTSAGLPEYAPAAAYAVGARVRHAGQAWISRRNANTGHAPDLAPAWWAHAGEFLVADPGSAVIVVAGDSWIYDNGSRYSNGYQFCHGLAAGMKARLGRDVASQIRCEGRGGETTAHLLYGNTCTTSSPTGGTANCWNEQVARWGPITTIFNLGTNDVRVAIPPAVYVANMMALAERARSIGSTPILVGPGPIEKALGDVSHTLSAHAYATLLRRAVIDRVFAETFDGPSLNPRLTGDGSPGFAMSLTGGRARIAAPAGGSLGRYDLWICDDLRGSFTMSAAVSRDELSSSSRLGLLTSTVRGEARAEIAFHGDDDVQAQIGASAEASIPFSGSTATFRIRRTGTTLYADVDMGGGFQNLLEVADPLHAAPLRARLFLRREDGGIDADHGAFDNLLLDGGAIDGVPNCDRDLDGIPFGDDCDDLDSCSFALAPEMCDGKDNDCDGAVDEDSPGAPGVVRGVGIAPDKTTLHWMRCGGEGPAGSGYDVVKGDLRHLLLEGGDFGAAVTACVARAVMGNTLVDPGLVGSAAFYLVRGRDACSAGSYDDGSAGLNATRDPGIGQAAAACP